jgi:hypothetical protein
MAALRALHPDREARGYSQKHRGDATRNCRYMRQSARGCRRCPNTAAARPSANPGHGGLPGSLRKQAFSPAFFVEAPGRPVFPFFRRKARGTARRLAQPILSAHLVSKVWRLSARHRGVFQRRAALCPRTARSMSNPPSASSWQGPLSAPGRNPGAARVQVCEICRRAPRHRCRVYPISGRLSPS